MALTSASTSEPSGSPATRCCRARHAAVARPASAPRGAGWPPAGWTRAPSRRRAADRASSSAAALERAGAAAPEHHRVALPGDRRRPAARGRRRRRPGAVAARAQRRTPAGRPPRLRPRLGVDRGQRRHQRHRHLPGRRRAGAHPRGRALRRVAHPLELRGRPVLDPWTGPDARGDRHQRSAVAVQRSVLALVGVDRPPGRRRGAHRARRTPSSGCVRTPRPCWPASAAAPSPSTPAGTSPPSRLRSPERLPLPADLSVVSSGCPPWAR